MQDYRVEAEVSKDGSVTIKGLPFQPGNRVEVYNTQPRPRCRYGEFLFPAWDACSIY